MIIRNDYILEKLFGRALWAIYVSCKIYTNQNVERLILLPVNVAGLVADGPSDGHISAVDYPHALVNTMAFSKADRCLVQLLALSGNEYIISYVNIF